MRNQLCHNLEINNSYYIKQFGFKSGYNTTGAEKKNVLNTFQKNEYLHISLCGT